MIPGLRLYHGTIRICRWRINILMTS